MVESLVYMHEIDCLEDELLFLLFFTYIYIFLNLVKELITTPWSHSLNCILFHGTVELFVVISVFTFIHVLNLFFFKHMSDL